MDFPISATHLFPKHTYRLQSPILTAHPLTSIAVDPSYLRIAVGAVDACLRVFDLASLPAACRCLQVSTTSHDASSNESKDMHFAALAHLEFHLLSQVIDVTKQLQRIAAAAEAAEQGGVLGQQNSAGHCRVRPGGGPCVITAGPRGGGVTGQCSAPGRGGPQQDTLAASTAAIGWGGLPTTSEGLTGPQTQLSNSILHLCYSPLLSISGADRLLGESPKLLVG